jgi:hypothetical protein
MHPPSSGVTRAALPLAPKARRRGDMQEAASLMITDLEGANAALNDGNATRANSFMRKDERQVEKIEKFPNR